MVLGDRELPQLPWRCRARDLAVDGERDAPIPDELDREVPQGQREAQRAGLHIRFLEGPVFEESSRLVCLRQRPQCRDLRRREPVLGYSYRGLSPQNVFGVHAEGTAVPDPEDDQAGRVGDVEREHPRARMPGGNLRAPIGIDAERPVGRRHIRVPRQDRADQRPRHQEPVTIAWEHEPRSPLPFVCAQQALVCFEQRLVANLVAERAPHVHVARRGLERHGASARPAVPSRTRAAWTHWRRRQTPRIDHQASLASIDSHSISLLLSVPPERR